MPDYEAYEALLRGLRNIDDNADMIWHTLLLTRSPKLRGEGDPLFYGLGDILDRVMEMRSLIFEYVLEEFSSKVQEDMVKEEHKHYDLLRELGYLVEALSDDKRTVSNVAAGNRPVKRRPVEGDDSTR